MSENERQIRMGDEQWTSVEPFAMPWRISAKGNPFLQLEIGRTRVVISVFPSRFRQQDEWTFSVMLGDGQWTPSRLFYATCDDAKGGALQHLAVVRRELEGGVGATDALFRRNETSKTTERPPDWRRIRLDDE